MAKIRLYDLDDEESNIYMDAADKAGTGSYEQAGSDAVQAHREKKKKKKGRNVFQQREKDIDDATGYRSKY